jgi:hypothetical protein
VVPFEFDLASMALKADSSLDWMQVQTSDIHWIADGREYLFVSTHGAETVESGLIALLSEPRSQFFRRVLANATGYQGMFDYKMYPFEDLSTATNRRLKDALAQKQRDAA